MKGHKFISLKSFLYTLAINGQKEFDFIFDSEGAYALYINGKLWLENGPTFFNGFGRRWSTNDLDYPIVLRNVKTVTGVDIGEHWQERQLTYSLGDTNTTVIAAIRVYTSSIYTTTKVLFRQVVICLLNRYVIVIPWFVRLYGR